MPKINKTKYIRVTYDFVLEMKEPVSGLSVDISGLFAFLDDSVARGGLKLLEKNGVVALCGGTKIDAHLYSEKSFEKRMADIRDSE